MRPANPRALPETEDGAVAHEALRRVMGVARKDHVAGPAPGYVTEALIVTFSERNDGALYAMVVTLPETLAVEAAVTSDPPTESRTSPAATAPEVLTISARTTESGNTTVAMGEGTTKATYLPVTASADGTARTS